MSVFPSSGMTKDSNDVNFVKKLYTQGDLKIVKMTEL